MQLGTFSVSLAVKNLSSSLDFYQKLGFEKVHGEADQGWLILANGVTKIGLFQGMFEANILTFNPGGGPNGTTTDDCLDIREIQKTLKERGLTFVSEVNEGTTGPASFTLTDPDGNTILFDQHL